MPQLQSMMNMTSRNPPAESSSVRERFNSHLPEYGTLWRALAASAKRMVKPEDDSTLNGYNNIIKTIINSYSTTARNKTYERRQSARPSYGVVIHRPNQQHFSNCLRARAH
jgi:hypothetical protein